ncbi:MAG: hypothetical protein AB8C40_08730 [Gammaproteobacteria bacterium]
MVRYCNLLFVLILCVSACSESDNASMHAKESEKTVLDPQLRALEKAKGVEQQLLDAASQQREVIDAYENQ